MFHPLFSASCDTQKQGVLRGRGQPAGGVACVTIEFNGDGLLTSFSFTKKKASVQIDQNVLFIRRTQLQREVSGSADGHN